MKRNIKGVAAVALALTVSGCAFMFGGAGVNWASQNPGPVPDYASSKQQALDAIKDALKDPNSAQFKNWTPFFKNLHNYGLGEGSGEALWQLCVQVNARNSYGGYNGYDWWFVKFKNGSAVRTSLGVGKSEYDCINGPADPNRRTSF